MIEPFCGKLPNGAYLSEDLMGERVLWQKRYMRQGLSINLFPLLSEIFPIIIDLSAFQQRMGNFA